MLCSRSAQTLVSLKIRPTAIPLLSPRSSSATARGDPASQVVLRRRLSTQIDPSRLLDNTRSNLLPEKLLTAALPFVPTHGFSSATILAGAASEPELQSLAISSWTLSNLFPSTTTTSAMINPTGPCTEPIGPSKALAERWIEEGNSHMKTTVKSENLVFKKHGLNGVQRAFEALALIVTPEDPFFGVRLPVELPHILPYGSHALNVAADALAGLQDYSKSREWMLRRIRLAGVYSAIELMSLGVDQPPVSTSNEIQKLLDASESLATHTSNTVEFINYVNRSSRSIIQSFGLI
ncbi:hypothetical protein Pst134EA_005034 [Puccinia striiformis f. sp. tritici]|uniref:hypothetical protein n=1 Tax=Puccinia striiformis f. sp. tritici TaxID=168172 RepID=UPI00200740D4|nr:hypothetical protein Pst134EA_005034 [Puccinia striiformis f. sp. tritici]KAH9471125.1 hypothetical protein Pst134EA_005034 [Puccinia striiformis f. sp. tritici]